MRKPGSLLVFSDDWGRHPSSCQHLVGELLDEFPVVWVNTIGMRTPKLDRVTLRRAAGKLTGWLAPSARSREAEKATPADPGVSCEGDMPVVSPKVISPKMWPWFTRPFDRRLNRRLLAAQLKPVIAAMPKPVVAITTIPITADLPGVLDVARWVYYCVDDFSEWPGLDGTTMAVMDRVMIREATELVSVSGQLQAHIRECGRDSTLLTHGVHLSHWRGDESTDPVAPEQSDPNHPTVLFWGVIDGRMDIDWIEALTRALPEAVTVLAGPQQNPPPRLNQIKGLRLSGPVAFERLPALAAKADVLVMPYIDAPVTRAMQPLKLKEYLATGRPVVVRDLPATRSWADCMDVASSPEAFVAAVTSRIGTKIPETQFQARKRLDDETWAAKARTFRAALMVDD